MSDEITSIWGGFELWQKPKSPKQVHGDLPVWEIIGTDAQIIQFPVAPGQTITCDSGAMCFTSDNIKMDAKLLGVMKMFGRAAGGGNFFSIEYKNEGSENGYVGMSPNFPGVVIPIDMTEYPSILCSRDSYLCSVGTGEDTVVSAGFMPAKSCLACCCSGESMVMQKISGGSMAFAAGMGTIVTKTLEANEELLVDTNSIVAVQDGVTFEVRRTGGCGVMCCGGEGIFNTVLFGPGKVWLESMSIGKLRKLFPPPPATDGGGGDNDGGGGE